MKKKKSLSVRQKTRKILLKAKRLLVTVGWCKYRNVQHAKDGHAKAYCLYGALNAASDTLRADSYNSTEMRHARALVLKEIDHCGIQEYNDFPHRRKADVLAVLDKALTHTR